MSIAVIRLRSEVSRKRNSIQDGIHCILRDRATASSRLAALHKALSHPLHHRYPTSKYLNIYESVSVLFHTSPRTSSIYPFLIIPACWSCAGWVINKAKKQSKISVLILLIAQCILFLIDSSTFPSSDTGHRHYHRPPPSNLSTVYRV